MNDNLLRHLHGIRRVLVEQFPQQCRAGEVDPSQWHDLHRAAEWLSQHSLELSPEEANGFNELLLWVQSHVNDLLAWMRQQIALTELGEHTDMDELETRFSNLWTEYDERARSLMRAKDTQLLDAPHQPYVRILFLAANPTTTSSLDLEEELRSLELELRSVKYRDRIRFVARHAVRPDDLLRHVRSERPNVIHFSGHGSGKGIVLRSDNGGHIEVSGESLRRLLDDRGVDLLVLNACYTKEQARQASGAVNAVVGTTNAVGDEAARRFTVAFYRSLGDGLSIREAFRDGGDSIALHGLKDVFWSSGELDFVPLTPDRR